LNALARPDSVDASQKNALPVVASISRIFHIKLTIYDDGHNSLIALGCELQCVGQKIVYHKRNLVLVEEHFAAREVQMEHWSEYQPEIDTQLTRLSEQVETEDTVSEQMVTKWCHQT
jgi:hypothetical protein